MSKFLVVTFSDNLRWKIPADFIAKDRAAYYAKLDSERGIGDYDELFAREMDYVLNSTYGVKIWASDSMIWKDVSAVASRLPDEEIEYDYGKEWTNAEMKVVELEG